MPRPEVPSRLRILVQVTMFALVGVAVAGCENSARFTSDAQLPPRDVTGSIGSSPVASVSVESQPLPAPSQPASVTTASGASYGDRGFTTYHPEIHNGEVIGSVPANHALTKPTGHWTWNGSSAVTVRYGQTLDQIARNHGVPVYAIMQTNGIRSAAAIHPGQRLVIPHYVYGVAARAPVKTPASFANNNNHVHVVEPGETLMAISRRTGISLTTLARANNIQPFTKIKIGQRLTIPEGGKVAEHVDQRIDRHVVERHDAAPKIARPRAVKEKVASAQVQNVRLAKTEEPQSRSVTHKAETVAAIPSFRWPVRGRIIAGFGRRPNGTENDGINLAVPEGTPIKAADDGVVAYAGNELKGYGNLVLIRHADGFVSAYADASKLLVKRGEHVKRGQVIARAGQTGNVSSPQLHFEIRKGSVPVNPIKFLNGA